MADKTSQDLKAAQDVHPRGIPHDVRPASLDDAASTLDSAPASLLLLLYQLVGEQNGVRGNRLTGTVQNDVLKEYIARGT